MDAVVLVCTCMVPLCTEYVDSMYSLIVCITSTSITCMPDYIRVCLFGLCLTVTINGGELDSNTHDRFTVCCTRAPTGISLTCRSSTADNFRQASFCHDHQQGTRKVLLEHLGVDFRRSVFSHGQLYDPMSQATNASEITVKTKDGERQVRYVVFEEVLNRL